MSNVEEKKLGDILNLKRGYDLPSYEREDGLYPIFSSSGISGYHSQYKADGEGVVIGRYGTLGEPYYFNGNTGHIIHLYMLLTLRVIPLSMFITY